MTKFQLGIWPSAPRGMVSNVVVKLPDQARNQEATFTIEDTTGRRGVHLLGGLGQCGVIQEDVIAKIKGKLARHNDQEAKSMVFEIEAIELSEDDVRPSHLPNCAFPPRLFDSSSLPATVSCDRIPAATAWCCS